MEGPDQSETGWLNREWMIGIIQLVFVIAVIGAALGLSSALKQSGGEGRRQISDLRAQSNMTVRIVQPNQVRYAPEVRVNGTVQANAEVAFSPQVSGEIKNVSPRFRSGSEVNKGDLLFEIDQADYLLAVERAESEIGSAASDLALLEAEAELAILEWEELYPGREVNELAARIPQIEAANARLASARANKRSAELSLQRTRVYAPLTARVINSSLDIGQIVSPGQSVGRLVALESIELSVPVSLDQLAVLEPVVGRTARFERRGLGSEARSAEIVRIDASLDPLTRLSNLYLVPETEAGLRIGDFVDVSITSDPIDGVLEIPAVALTGQSNVWVIEQGRLASRQIIALGERDAGTTILAMPFDIADGLVALPPLDAQEGQAVSARAESTTTAAAGR